MKFKQLEAVSSYSSDRVEVRKLGLKNYISTENMLTNKAGVVSASKLPTGKTTSAYQKGDILISNIRPYFKKIWFADNEGGCSNDVLVIRANPGIDSKFLYYVLADDKFFEYDTANSKGTKMPRGDKTAIMRYEIPDLTLDEQRTIAETLSTLDDRIAENKKINHHLVELAVSIWQKRFSSQDTNGKLGDIIELYDSKRVPLSSKQRQKMDKIYPYYGATSLMDYVDNYLFDGIYLLLGEDGTVISEEGYPILQYVWGKFWVNNHAHILVGRNGFTVESLYVLLKSTNVSSIVTGAVQLKINQANLKSVEVYIPSAGELESFNSTIKPIFDQLRNSTNEIETLTKLRDSLLPKLMSGEISVAD
ncbi:TPA_asm: restriction endonuclease subunit S [Listeria monocytogenes]|nr:restriction endonuclease subunit S [Listeria monocytogenes]EAE2458849.1 restriction endonuclease subunit S [Listeria monocytogenes]HAC6039174.1 restriction endonuclease subunit S [Listeria monocytogenes]